MFFEYRSSKVFCTIKEGEVPAIPENRFLLRGMPKDKDKDEVTVTKSESKKHSKKGRSRSRSRNRSRSRSRGRDRDRRDKDRDQRPGNRNEKEAPRYGRMGRNNNDGKKVKGRGRIVRKYSS